MAILLGALMIHGLQPGPLLIRQAPDLFWGVITSMYIGNVMLLILNLPLVGIWAKLLRVPYALLFPLILLFCLIGAYSVANNVGDGIVMWVFGIVGYLMKKFEYEGAPAHPGDGDWADDGRVAPAIADPVARGLRDLRRAADFSGLPHRGGRAAGAAAHHAPAVV
jgi:hypothetical protein